MAASRERCASRRAISIVSVAGLVAGLLAFTATVATAGTTISVDTLADTTGTGDCSLRDAIAAANEDASVGGCPAGSGADTIVFGGLSGTIFLQASLPMVGSEFFSSSVDIDGSGSNVTIDGQGMFSGFRVYQASVDFSDLTVTHMLRAVGAALLVQEGSIVSLVDMILTNNVASFAGGAVHVSSSAPLIVIGLVMFLGADSIVNITYQQVPSDEEDRPESQPSQVHND
jgi:CSLREA domain-containing protein